MISLRVLQAEFITKICCAGSYKGKRCIFIFFPRKEIGSAIDVDGIDNYLFMDTPVCTNFENDQFAFICSFTFNLQSLPPISTRQLSFQTETNHPDLVARPFSSFV